MPTLSAISQQLRAGRVPELADIGPREFDRTTTLREWWSANQRQGCPQAIPLLRYGLDLTISEL